MRLRHSRKFEADLETIGDYLEHEAGAQVAEALVRRIRLVSRDLLARPRAFPIWQVRPDLGLRRRLVGRYVIFYRVGDDAVGLVRVVHGARDIEGVLEDEG